MASAVVPIKNVVQPAASAIAPDDVASSVRPNAISDVSSANCVPVKETWQRPDR